MNISRFFVRHTTLDPLNRDAATLEVQMLDDEGRARASVLFPASVDRVLIGDYEVPILVIRAAAETEMGAGRFVDAEGKETPPY